MSQYIQQAVFHNDNQFTLYGWEEISEVVNLMKNPNFSCLTLVSIKYLLLSCYQLRLLVHWILHNDDMNWIGMFTADASLSVAALSQYFWTFNAA